MIIILWGRIGDELRPQSSYSIRIDRNAILRNPVELGFRSVNRTTPDSHSIAGSDEVSVSVRAQGVEGYFEEDASNG